LRIWFSVLAIQKNGNK